jgi:hypothetical protein
MRCIDERSSFARDNIPIEAADFCKGTIIGDFRVFSLGSGFVSFLYR